MFEDILGEEEKITWENGYYYAPYIPLQFTVFSKSIKAKTRKLKGRWTLESAQELEIIYGIKLIEEMRNESTIDCNFQI